MILHSSLQNHLPNDCQALAKQREAVCPVWLGGRGLEKFTAGTHIRKARFAAPLVSKRSRTGSPGSTRRGHFSPEQSQKNVATRLPAPRSPRGFQPRTDAPGRGGADVATTPSSDRPDSERGRRPRPASRARRIRQRPCSRGRRRRRRIQPRAPSPAAPRPRLPLHPSARPAARTHRPELCP